MPVSPMAMPWLVIPICWLGNTRLVQLSLPGVSRTAVVLNDFRLFAARMFLDIFFNEITWPALGLEIDLADIFADHADAQQLNAAEQIDRYHR